ncbi:MAG: hypothetical protein M1839_004497 [Geoglossum umbratile]|nr:MAG: hypothetical protein M1839_004497 [Geoglossum umbratile]
MYNVYNEAHIPPWGFSVKPAGNNPFGALNSAALMAVGFALTATISYETPYKASATRGKGSAYVWPDYDYTLSGKSHVPDRSEVVLFLMSTKIIRTISYEHSMLILRRIAVSEAEEETIAKEDGQWAPYERIGYANCDSDDADIDFSVCKKRDLIMLF